MIDKRIMNMYDRWQTNLASFSASWVEILLLTIQSGNAALNSIIADRRPWISPIAK